MSIRHTSAALSVVLLAGGLGVPLAVAAVAHADAGQTAPAVSSSPQASAAAAVAEARRTGKSVGIPSLTTSTETVTANPSGTTTMTESVFPTRVKRGGVWVSVDPSLHVAADGSLQPAAVPSDVTLSGGGTAPLAILTNDGRQLSVSWPEALPKPTISGATATYAEVMPGVDLQATVTPLGGFSDMLVVKNAAAAANPKLASLAFTTHTSGLTVASNANGSIAVTDRNGVGIFGSPSASMWDSSTGPGSGTVPKQAAAAAMVDGDTAAESQTARSSSAGPGYGAKVSRVAAAVSAGHLTLTPDSQMLRGAGTHYPVYIDPELDPMPADDALSGYDEIQQGCPDKNAFKSHTAPYDTPGVGLNDYSGCIGIERALYQFNVDTHLWNTSARVIDATFKAEEVYSASCSVTSDVKVSYVTNSIGLSTTWNNRPGPGTLQDTKTFGSACSSGQSQGFTVADAFAAQAKAGKSSVTLAVTAANEGNDLYFRRFSNNPTVTVEYNTLPTVTSATTSPNTSIIGHTSITLNAYVKDPDDGAGVQAKFTLVGKDATGKQVYPVADSPTQPLEPVAQVTEQGYISWRVGYLPTGTYTWTAQADDGDKVRAGGKLTRTFTVDATAPGTPHVDSLAVHPQPANQNIVLTPAARTEIQFDITPPDGATDIKYYAYNWGTPPPTVNPPLRVTAKSDGSATLLATPIGFVRDQLYVYAVDAAGNESVSQDFAFNAGKPDKPDPTGDLTGDGRPDLLATGADGNLRVYPAAGAGQLANPINLWDTDEGGSTNFTGEKLAVGKFGKAVEQDVLAVTPTGAMIYLGNGDAEPLPCSTIPEQCAAESQTAIFLPGPDPNTGGDLPSFPWADVAQVAADDSQQPHTTMPNLWLITTDGSLYFAKGTTTFGDFGVPKLIASGFQNTTIAYAGLVNTLPALWVRNTSSGALSLYTSNDAATPAGSSTLPAPITVASSGWGSGTVDSIFSAGGANTGSGAPDLWATDTEAVHNVYYYPAGATAGTLAARTRVQTLSPSDDFNADGKADIAAVWGDGTLHMYKGEGSGELTSGAQIWDSTWSTVTAMASADFTGDGKSDVVARWGDGSLHLYPGTGTGALDPTHVTTLYGLQTWSSVRQLTAGDFTGDGLADVVAIWSDGSLHLYPNDHHGGIQAQTSMWPKDGTWSGFKLLSAGDCNGDGNSDILAVRVSDGELRLYLGDGAGNLAAGKDATGILDWSTVKDIIPGDFTGDGKVDLAAIWNDGSLHLYTGDGSGGFTHTKTMGDDPDGWATVKLAT